MDKFEDFLIQRKDMADRHNKSLELLQKWLDDNPKEEITELLEKHDYKSFEPTVQEYFNSLQGYIPFKYIVEKIKEIAIQISPYFDLKYHTLDDIKRCINLGIYELTIDKSFINIQFIIREDYETILIDEIWFKYIDVDNPIELTIEKYKNIQLKEQEEKRLAEEKQAQKVIDDLKKKESEEYQNYLKLQKKYGNIIQNK